MLVIILLNITLQISYITCWQRSPVICCPVMGWYLVIWRVFQIRHGWQFPALDANIINPGCWEKTDHAICWLCVGVLGLFSHLIIFFNFQYYRNIVKYHIYIWQLSMQLSCIDTCQILMWYSGSSRWYCKNRKFPIGRINKHSIL